MIDTIPKLNRFLADKRAHYERLAAESRRLIAASERIAELQAAADRHLKDAREPNKADQPTAQDFVDLVAQEYQVSDKIALSWLQCAGLMEFDLPPAV